MKRSKVKSSYVKSCVKYKALEIDIFQEYTIAVLTRMLKTRIVESFGRIKLSI